MSDSEDNLGATTAKKSRLNVIKSEDSNHTEGSGDEIVSLNANTRETCGG